MAYRWRQHEDLACNLQRIASEELQGIIDALGEMRAARQTETIHEARRGIKKLRALLRLTRFAMPKVQRRENRALRDLGRQLSALRDAGAMVETFDDVLGLGRLKGHVRAAAAVRRGLIREWQKAEQGLDIHHVMGRARSAAEATAERVVQWSVRDQGFEVLQFGLSETYRRGRKAMRRAVRTQDVDALHAWRKRAKDHWFQLRLMAGRHPVSSIAKLTVARKLEQALGNDRNLALLENHLCARPQPVGSESFLLDLLEVVRERQKELRQEAEQAGSQVYALATTKWQKGWKFQKKNAASVKACQAKLAVSGA